MMYRALKTSLYPQIWVISVNRDPKRIKWGEGVALLAHYKVNIIFPQMAILELKLCRTIQRTLLETSEKYSIWKVQRGGICLAHFWYFCIILKIYHTPPLSLSLSMGVFEGKFNRIISIWLNNQVLWYKPSISP